MRVLGIESSCDETAAAVVTSTGEVLSDVVRSQVAAHAAYGGVVPEVAARDHLRAVGPVVREALRGAGTELAELDAVAVTSRPGLVGALLVGVAAAKALAWAADKPLVGVDHLVGHLLSPFLRLPNGCPIPRFPYIALLVSGGHTALYRCDAPDVMTELGGTRDDAAGEAYDKVAKLLELGYPGGPIVDKLAAQGDAKRFADTLPRPMAHNKSLEMSFSGLKTAVARLVRRDPPSCDQDRYDLCATFQAHVTRTLVAKTLLAAERQGVRNIVVTGGVAANRELRERMARACEKRELALSIPPLRACTDNAAMIGYAGALAFARGERAGMDLSPSPRTALPRVTRKGGGRRPQP